MRASESPFQTYKSKRILFFANLNCSSVSGPKELKKRYLCFAILSCSEKRFRNSISKMWSVCTKIALIEKKIRKKNSHTLICCLSVYLPTVIIWGQLDKLSMSYSVRFKWKRLIPELATLNITIRRVIFTSGQNLKPPFLCQYLIFFHDIFFILEISVGSLLKSKNRILNKITDLKVYRNLKQVTTTTARRSNCFRFYFRQLFMSLAFRSLYISLPSPANKQREITKLCVL